MQLPVWFFIHIVKLFSVPLSTVKPERPGISQQEPRALITVTPLANTLELSGLILIWGAVTFLVSFKQPPYFTVTMLWLQKTRGTGTVQCCCKTVAVGRAIVLSCGVVNKFLQSCAYLALKLWTFYFRLLCQNFVQTYMCTTVQGFLPHCFRVTAEQMARNSPKKAELHFVLKACRVYVWDMRMDFMLFGAIRTDKALCVVFLHLNYSHPSVNP